MKNKYMKWFFVLVLGLLVQTNFAQVVTTNPTFPQQGDAVVVTFNALQGNAGLANYAGDVYAHTGVITDKSTSDSDWKYVIAAWSTNLPKAKLTRIDANTYTLSITPSIKEYYGVPANENIKKMAFVFRGSTGSPEGKDVGGKDIFALVYEPELSLQVTKPATNNAIVALNSDVELEAQASASSNMQILVDNVSVQSLTGVTTIATTYNTTTSGLHEVVFKANDGTTFKEEKRYFYTEPTTVNATKPNGLVKGINYNKTDNTKATLVLFAPQKQYIFVVGDFNNWMLNPNYLMKKDGDYFWLELTNLVPNQEYIFQYFVDGAIRVADPYCEKISDPWNDKWINNTATVYPNLIAYPDGKTEGTASVLETNRPAYNWQVANFDRPDISKLVIYELHFRDFTTEGTVNAAKAKLDYLQNLGVNAIELMPFSEFEGNDSWGYNPSFYFAPDKAYGTREDYKAFIDECHSRGMAVIQDMVLNHSYGQSPFLKMYYDAANDRPTANNPWYNEYAPNTEYAWGYDFNHESTHTQELVDSVNSFWINEYKIDGFRFDFTKGFTNVENNGWAYDQSRINILNRMAGEIWKFAPTDRHYVILEHLTDNSEELALANAGMMLWGNMNSKYNELVMGFPSNSDISWASYQQRGFNYPNLIAYMESHDEERLIAKSLVYGNSAVSTYDLKVKDNAIARLEVAANMYIPMPGPKMIWQFGELGYDYSIEYNGRTGRKPVKWEYFDEPVRKRVYQVFAALNKLKTTEPAFSTWNYDINVGAWGQKRIRLFHSDMDVIILGNTDVYGGNSNAAFTKTGTWYEYFSGESMTVSNLNTDIPLFPGEYKIFTTKQLPKPTIGNNTVVEQVRTTKFNVFPNPSSDILFIETMGNNVDKLEIMNLLGEKVLEMNNLGNNPQINVSEIKSGIYIVNIYNKNGKSTEKVMINR